MPATKTQRSAAAKKAAATRKRRATGARRTEAITRTTDLSDDVLKSVESGQRSAIEAVRKFVDTVDQKLPPQSRASAREEVIDGAMEMADKLVHAQYDFLRKVVAGAGKSLSTSDRAK